ncbi:MAG: protein kinase [Verrucomicrobiaceae bacterium]|nr:protein kinase [Verrucomicrobiaceae bacterium]
MNPAPDQPCPKCGSAMPAEALGGVCAACFASGALDEASGWLFSSSHHEADDHAWPQVPGWQITGIIGAGGMGRVYRAQSFETEQLAAIKVLEGAWSRDPLMSARFEAEADALKRLDHPNIVRVLETCESDDGRLCIVMELAEGCDLGRLMRAGRLEKQRAISIFTKVCSAVEHAHEQGIAHRDIKPANILITGEDEVKLADFGLAKEGSASTIGALTATTDQFGTAYYLAPERMISRDPAGPPQDVYALGVLLYHLLTGQMPMGNYTPASKLAELPPTFDGVIASALEADPAQRTGSVETLREAATRAWQQHLDGAKRQSWLKRSFITAAALVFSSTLVVGGATWQRARNQPPPPQVFSPPSSATTDAPWQNSLGMKFVPVEGTSVLFSIWETRRRDVEPFIGAERALIASSYRVEQAERDRKNFNIQILGPGGRLTLGGSWADPGFPVTPDHPACFLLARDADRFCQWLTWKEQNEGRLAPGQCYRLPTAAEWLIACGGEDAEPRSGNVAGPEARDDHWNPRWPTFTERDAFPRLAPVGSFPAEPHGLHDISGNVSEWVLRDRSGILAPSLDFQAILLGPDFHDGSPETVSFRHRRPVPNNNIRLPNIGFRIVLEHQKDGP